MYLIPNKTGKNRKKPVETNEFVLTKSLKKLKVNCGRVLHTRMNIEDLHREIDAVFDLRAGQASDR
jgi:hypothetical protein